MTQYKPRLSKEEYTIYLKSSHWFEFKKMVYASQKCCEYCKSKKDLNIHHKTYRTLGREKRKDVVVLCKDCHYKLHDAKFSDAISIRDLGFTRYFRICQKQNKQLPEEPKPIIPLSIKIMGTVRYFYELRKMGEQKPT